MGNIYRRSRSPYWYLDFFDAQGKRVRRSAKTADPQLAQRKLERAEAAVRREREASDPDLQMANDLEEDIERDQGLADKIARLGNDVEALKQRQAYYERELEHLREIAGDAVPKVRDYARKLAYLREVLAHGIAEIDRGD
jgi:hypothetical protein